MVRLRYLHKFIEVLKNSKIFLYAAGLTLLCLFLRHVGAFSSSFDTLRWLYIQKKIQYSSASSIALFVGDSRVHGLDLRGLKSDLYCCVNSGFGGDFIEDTLWRLRRLDLSKYESGIIFIQVGINNAKKSDYSVSQFNQSVEEILVLVEGNSKLDIVWYLIFPRLNGGSHTGEFVEEVNEGILVEVMKGQGRVVSLNDAFEVGFYQQDGLHLNAQGNARWLESLALELSVYFDSSPISGI